MIRAWAMIALLCSLPILLGASLLWHLIERFLVNPGSVIMGAIIGALWLCASLWALER